jgi:hypothetical protein
MSDSDSVNSVSSASLERLWPAPVPPVGIPLPPGLGLRPESPPQRRLRAAERQTARANQRLQQALVAMVAAQGAAEQAVENYRAEYDAWAAWLTEVHRLQAEAEQAEAEAEQAKTERLASNEGDAATETDWVLI